MSLFLEHIGHRTETYSGSGVCDMEHVVSFEILELGNTDILDTLLYKTSFIQDTDLRTDMTAAITWLETHGAPGWDRFEIEYPNDTKAEKHLRSLIPRMLDEVKKHSLKDLKYALWLADYEAVADKNRYGEYITAPESEIHKYEISGVMLSDCGCDGALFAYAEPPTPMCN